MKTKPALLLLALPFATTLPAQSTQKTSPTPTVQTVTSGPVTPGSILAAQIQEIAATKELNAASKRRQIASAVRLAVTTALTNVKDAEQAYQILLELAAEAAKALPDYGNLIADSAVSAGLKLPVLAGRTDLAAKLIDAVAAVVAEASDSSSEAAGAETRGRREKERGESREHEFEGKKDDIVVSPSR